MTKPTQPSETVSATVAPATESAGTDARIAHLEAENERLKVLIVGLLYADEDAFEQARTLVKPNFA
jgi:hypothetical protein